LQSIEAGIAKQPNTPPIGARHRSGSGNAITELVNRSLLPLVAQSICHENQGEHRGGPWLLSLPRQRCASLGVWR